MYRSLYENYLPEKKMEMYNYVDETRIYLPHCNQKDWFNAEKEEKKT